MLPPVHCKKCGNIFRSAITISGETVTLVGNLESCPRCGAICQSPDGTFKLGDELLRAVREKGVTRDKVQAFRDTAQAVAAGDKTATEAVSELEQLSQAFAAILHAANQNAPAMAILVSILSLIVAWYAIICSYHNAEIAHIDAQAQLTASPQQTNEQAIAKLNADVARLNALAESSAAQPPLATMWRTEAPTPAPMTARPTNRHERRSAKSKKRKQTPS